MPESADLLAAARLLLSGTSEPPSEARLRRAVSTAYYALFHTVLRAGAARFMGDGNERSAGFRLFYRGFNHRCMKDVCESLDAPTLKGKVQEQLGRTVVSKEMRSFASTFAALQAARHLADYDPSVVFALSDSVELVDTAAAAMAAFDLVPPDEKADVLALMLVNPRG